MFESHLGPDKFHILGSCLAGLLKVGSYTQVYDGVFFRRLSYKNRQTTLTFGAKLHPCENSKDFIDGRLTTSILCNRSQISKYVNTFGSCFYTDL